MAEPPAEPAVRTASPANQMLAGAVECAPVSVENLTVFRPSLGAGEGCGEKLQ